MYLKLEEGRRFHFFKKEKEDKDGNKITCTDKAVFGTLSEGVRVGETYGNSIWENDYWNVIFCGRAYEDAKKLNDADYIEVFEMNIRNRYVPKLKKNFPQINIFNFKVVKAEEKAQEGYYEPDTSDLLYT